MSLLLTALLMAAESPRAAATELPAWLAGAWIAREPSGVWSEEWWTTARAGLMLGGSRSGKGSELGFFEHMRIGRTASGLEFCALPKGQAGGCFPATSVTATEIVFENPAHDYPTRIAYRRIGGGIEAEISGPNGARRQQWRFVPLRD